MIDTIKIITNIIITLNLNLFFRKYIHSNYFLVEAETEHPCLAYQRYNDDPLYGIKDVDCRTKAPFICLFNPGVNHQNIHKK